MRWCTVSETEQKKCAELSKALVAVLPPAAVNAFARLSCVRAYSTADCIDKIRVTLIVLPPFLTDLCTHTFSIHLFDSFDLCLLLLLFFNPHPPSLSWNSLLHICLAASNSQCQYLSVSLSSCELIFYIMIINLHGFLSRRIVQT